MYRNAFDVYLQTLQEQEQARSRLENQPRLAQVHKTLGYSGAGSVRAREVKFGLAFVSEPSFASGRALIKPPPEGYQLPIGDVVVEGWLLDERNLYVGCTCYLSVYVPTLLSTGVTPEEPPNTQMVFHLTFWGTALKDTARIPGAGDRDLFTRQPGL